VTKTGRTCQPWTRSKGNRPQTRESARARQRESRKRPTSSMPTSTSTSRMLTQWFRPSAPATGPMVSVSPKALTPSSPKPAS